MKTTNDLCFESVLQILLYDVLLEEQMQRTTNNKIMIYNCLKGVKYEIMLKDRESTRQAIQQVIINDQFDRAPEF